MNIEPPFFALVSYHSNSLHVYGMVDDRAVPSAQRSVSDCAPWNPSRQACCLLGNEAYGGFEPHVFVVHPDCMSGTEYFSSVTPLSHLPVWQHVFILIREVSQMEIPDVSKLLLLGQWKGPAFSSKYNQE